MKNFTLKVAAVLFCAAMSSVSFAGTPYVQVTLSKDAPVRIEGEHFDKGGSGVGFYWADQAPGGVEDFRADEIIAADGHHLAGINYSENASNNYICGWTNNCWTIYTVNVKDAGNYKFTMIAGAGEGGRSTFTLTNLTNGMEGKGNLVKDGCSGWDNGDLESEPVILTLQAGENEIKFATGGGFNFDAFDVEYTTEEPALTGNNIPGTIDCLSYLTEEGDYYWWIVVLGDISSPSNGGGNIGWTTDISNYESGAEAESPDFVKYNVTIRKAGDYYVYFNASNSGDDHLSACNLYFYSTPLNDEPIEFMVPGSWGDYAYVQGGKWHYDEDEFEGVMDEPTVITITEDMVGENKKIKLECVHQWNMQEFKFVPVDQADGVDAVTATRCDNVYYNLQGMKVTNPTKGIYIINGKKVIM